MSHVSLSCQVSDNTLSFTYRDLDFTIATLPSGLELVVPVSGYRLLVPSSAQISISEVIATGCRAIDRWLARRHEHFLACFQSR